MLSNQSLIEILGDWSFWESPPPPALTRQLTLPKNLHSDLALIIQGVRRCGKSTLLSQLPAHYHLALAKCYYCNFEDPRLMNDLDHKLLSRIVALAREKIPAGSPCYFFFDEIQNVQEWEKWLHTQLERPKENYFVLTGSNSCLLGGEFATALTGRHITLELFPFSFVEYKTIFPKNTLEDYLRSGGFPRPLTFDQHYRVVQALFRRPEHANIISENMLLLTNLNILSNDNYKFVLLHPELGLIDNNKLIQEVEKHRNSHKARFYKHKQTMFMEFAPLFKISDRPNVFNAPLNKQHIEHGHEDNASNKNASPKRGSL